MSLAGIGRDVWEKCVTIIIGLYIIIYDYDVDYYNMYSIYAYKEFYTDENARSIV